MPVVVVVVVLFLSGVARSIGFTTYHSLAFADIEADELADANILNASVQELATGFGIACAALLLSLLTSYPVTYLVLGAVMAATLVETIRLPKDAGAHLSR